MKSFDGRNVKDGHETRNKYLNSKTPVSYEKNKVFDDMMDEINEDNKIQNKHQKLAPSEGNFIKTASKESKGENDSNDDSDEETKKRIDYPPCPSPKASFRQEEFVKSKDHSFSNKSITVDMNASKSFITRCIPKGNKRLQCYVERDKSGFNMLRPIYRFFLDDGNQFLLTAQKRNKSKTSNYLISMDRSQIDRKSNLIVGKLRANWSGSEYILYDHGLNPKKTVIESSIRKIIGIILFNYDKAGPGCVTGGIPKINEAGTPIICKDTNQDEGIQMANELRNSNMTRLHLLRYKKPKYDEKAGGHVLNFHGRVNMSSVKNFQMESDCTGDETILQFGRISCQPLAPTSQCSCHKNRFNLDIGYPLSPLQAFAICLATLDGKVADSKGFDKITKLTKK